MLLWLIMVTVWSCNYRYSNSLFVHYYIKARRGSKFKQTRIPEQMSLRLRGSSGPDAPCGKISTYLLLSATGDSAPSMHLSSWLATIWRSSSNSRVSLSNCSSCGHTFAAVTASPALWASFFRPTWGLLFLQPAEMVVVFFNPHTVCLYLQFTCHSALKLLLHAWHHTQNKNLYTCIQRRRNCQCAPPWWFGGSVPYDQWHLFFCLGAKKKRKHPNWHILLSRAEFTHSRLGSPMD